MPHNFLEDLLKNISKVLSRDGNKVNLSVKQGSNGHTYIQTERKVEPTLDWQQTSTSIVDWTAKFNRQKAQREPLFDPDEVVHVNGFVTKENDEYMIHVDADGRVADNFYLRSQAPELAAWEGMPLEVLLNIGEERKAAFQISNIQNYDATLVGIVSVPPINPTLTQLQECVPRQRVMIEGTFVRFDESEQDKFLQSRGFPKGSKIGGQSSCGTGDGNLSVELSILTPDGQETEYRDIVSKEQRYSDNATRGYVQADDGQEFVIDLPTGKINFSGGVLENIAGRNRKIPQEGDHIRLAAYVTADRKLSANFCDPCLLLTPSMQRQHEYDELRAKVQHQLANAPELLDTRNYSSLRILLGNVRSLEMTKAELEQTRTITTTIPTHERPMQTPVTEHNKHGETDFWVRAIDRAYDVCLESMSKEEFIAFAKDAVSGKIPQTGREADCSYIFRIAESFGMESGTVESMITSCLDARLPRIQTLPYNHGRDWDDYYAVEMAFKYLSGIGSETSAERVFKELRSAMAHKNYCWSGWRAERENQRPGFVYILASAIRDHHEQMSPTVLHKELPYLTELAVYLEHHSEEDIAVQLLHDAVGRIKETLQSVC